MPRFFVDTVLHQGAMELPERAARHVQVLRMQPGDALILFDGQGGEWAAVITDMKRRVAVQVQSHHTIERETKQSITLAVGMPANENMDWLVEKATELGVHAIQPLSCERSVLKLQAERAEKKRVHWQGIAISASEQCGRNRVPLIHAVQSFSDWLRGFAHTTANAVEGEVNNISGSDKFILSTSSGVPLGKSIEIGKPVIFLSGPEGGFTAKEEQAAIATGFNPISLGARILRAETAPLAVLAILNHA